MKEEFKILCVDDTKSNIDILMGLLKNEYRITPALSAKKALSIIEKMDIDLILLDIVMPEIDGFEMCKILKKNPITKNIPIIFISSQSEECHIEEAYDIGGIDYITKPFKPKELLAKIKREIKLLSLQKELRLLASTDSMTKLYNRRYFKQISEHNLDFAKRENENLSIIMLDIDKFKNINDTYGHQVGDDVIIALANTLQEHQRKSDIICRYGGEEFVILLPNTSIDGASIVANKIKNEIELIDINSNKNINITASFGISLVNLQDESTIEEALARADKALYNAKESGRNRVCIYN